MGTIAPQPLDAPLVPTALIEKSNHQNKHQFLPIKKNQLYYSFSTVQHTSNKTKVPNQSSAILKRPQKSETIFLYFDWLKFASLVNHNTELPGAPERRHKWSVEWKIVSDLFLRPSENIRLI